MVEVVGTWVHAGGVASIPLAVDGVRAAPRADAPRSVKMMFLSLYKTVGEKVRSLSTEVMDEMRRLMDKYKDEDLSF
jgi:hypothetical protein